MPNSTTATVFLISLLTSALTGCKTVATPTQPDSAPSPFIVNGRSNLFYSLRNISQATISLGKSDREQWEGEPDPVSPGVAAKDPEGYHDELFPFERWVVVNTVANSIDASYLWYLPDPNEEKWVAQPFPTNLGYVTLLSEPVDSGENVVILANCYTESDPLLKNILLTLHPDGTIERKPAPKDADDIRFENGKTIFLKTEKISLGKAE